jgi:hypothetical protein
VREKHDLAVGVPPLEFFEGVGDLVNRKAGGDIEIDGAGRDQVGDFGEHFQCPRLPTGRSLGAASRSRAARPSP